eukprot:342286-Hanusia_phi.AAC.1
MIQSDHRLGDGTGWSRAARAAAAARAGPTRTTGVSVGRVTAESLSTVQCAARHTVAPPTVGALARGPAGPRATVTVRSDPTHGDPVTRLGLASLGYARDRPGGGPGRAVRPCAGPYGTGVPSKIRAPGDSAAGPVRLGEALQSDPPSDGQCRTQGRGGRMATVRPQCRGAVSAAAAVPAAAGRPRL